MTPEGTAPVTVVGTPVTRPPRFLPLLLMLVFMANLLDRQVLTILAEPIRRELGLSDGQIGVLSGFAFAAVYGLVTLPMGRLADRLDRVTLISAATLAWSAMCAACGLATSFAQLCAARMAVAVGEAGAGPPIHSLLSTFYPPERRAQAIAIVQAGGPLGVLVAFGVGGPIAGAFGWRAAFFAAAVPGVVIALAARLLLRDPRPAQATAPGDGPAGTRAWPAFVEIVRTPRMAPYLLCGVFAGVAVFGEAVWVPILFQRDFGWSVGRAGAVLGPLIGLLGMLGTWLGGLSGDLAQRRNARGHSRIVAGSMLLSAVALAPAILARDAGVALALFLVPFVLLVAFQGPLAAAVQNAAPARHRAFAASIYILGINFLGLGLGPTLVGILSDRLAAGGVDAPLRTAMLLIPAAAAACGLLALLSGRRGPAAASAPP